MRHNKELKPCPFCGGEAEVFDGNFFTFIKCKLCFVSTKAVAIEKNNKGKARREVEELWNRRTDDAYKQG
jgi:hypothetical protein